MSIRRTFRPAELSSITTFANPDELLVIEQALLAGHKVEMVESEFKDPTDFCRVEVNGRPALHIPGY